MAIEWEEFKYYCPKCFNIFSLATKNKQYNVEVKCPKCGFILRKEQK